MSVDSVPSASHAGTDKPPRGALAGGWEATRHFRPVLVLLAAMVIVFGATQSVFLSSQNIENTLTAVSIIWVVAIGMTFVLVSGGFDLSVGAIAAFAGIFLAKVLGLGVPGGVALILTLLAGGLIGALLNGVLVGVLGLSVFVVTLASGTALTGLVNLWTQTQSVYVTDPIVGQIAVNSILGIPTLIWIMALVFVVGLYLQRRTLLGRDIYAIGGNRVAARLSGIRTTRNLVIVYGMVGVCAALGGVIAVGRTGAASPQVDTTLPLEAIAGVLLGGTSLIGGSGGVGGTFFGVLFIGVLQNGLSILGVQSYWQQVVTGVILVTAVLADRVAVSDTVRTRRLVLRSASPA